MPFRLYLIYVLVLVTNIHGEKPEVTSTSYPCGHQFTQSHGITKRIVGGATSQVGVWPWQIALLLDGKQVCAGSLISSRWVISAGHCFMDPRSSADESRWTVLLGERNKKSKIKSHFEKERRVKLVIVHPKFHGVILNGEFSKPIDNDIALLELEEPVQFDENIYPICLPTNRQRLVPGKMCYITGWGKNGWKGTRSKILRQAAVPLIARDQCNKKESYNGQVHRTSICAGYEDGSADACQSDSGGPLSCQDSGRWYLAGVISWGKKCAQPNKYGVYANVEVLKSWIIDTIYYTK